MAGDFDGIYGQAPPGHDYDIEGNLIGFDEIIRRAKYRSTGICKAMPITKERLKDWLTVGFIRPTIPAFGQGTKAGYTKGDVYSIALFMKLLRMGFKREFAASVIKPIMGIVGNEKIFSRYLLVTIESTGVGEMPVFGFDCTG